MSRSFTPAIATHQYSKHFIVACFHTVSRLSSLAWLVLLAQSPVQSIPPAEERIEKLADGIFAHIVQSDGDAVSNAGFIVLHDSVFVFDSHSTPEAGQRLLAEIREITPKPIRYLVNSHFHADHTHGNQSLGSVPQIIATTNARRDILQQDIPSMNLTLRLTQSQLEKMQKEVLQAQDAARQNALRDKIRERRQFMERLRNLKILVPSMTVDDRLDLHDATRALELLYLGRGHTEGDLILFAAKDKIAFLGDLFYNRALPYTQDAFLLEWIATLGEVLKLDAEIFVPGHGAPGTKEDVKDFKNYLEALKGLVEAAVKRGDSIQQILRDARIPSRYASYDFQNFFPANVQKMYIELKGLQPAPPAPSKKP